MFLLGNLGIPCYFAPTPRNTDWILSQPQQYQEPNPAQNDEASKKDFWTVNEFAINGKKLNLNLNLKLKSKMPKLLNMTNTG